MDEIRKLQEQLSKLQVLPSVQRLSDRNVIEIVSKLKERGLVDLLVTQSREYITPKRVEREISDQVYVSGGRINLVDLVPLIELDLPRIEERTKALCRRDGSLRLLGGEILSDDYLSQVGAEIEESLSETGYVTLDNLARRFHLPSEMIAEEIVAQHVSGTIKDGVIYTAGFVARHAASVRGALSALTKPTQLSHVLNRGGFMRELFDSTLEDLVASGRVDGTIAGRGDRAVFTPAAHARSQREAVLQRYRDNGYCEYDSIAKIGISADPQEYLTARFPEGTALETVYVGPALLSQFQATLEEVAESSTWLEPSEALPSPFVLRDVTTAVERSELGKNALRAVGARFYASPGLIDAVDEKVREDLSTRVREALTARLEARAGGGASGSAAAGGGPASGAAGGNGGGGGKKGGKAAAADAGGAKLSKRELRKLQEQEALAAIGGGGNDSDSDDSDGGGRRGKKGKKGKKGGGKKGGGGKAAAGGKGPGAGSGSSNEFDPLEGDLTAAMLAAMLESLPEDVLPQGMYGEREDFCKALGTTLLSSASGALTEARKASVAGKSATREMHQAVAERLTAVRENLHILSRGNASISDEQVRTQLDRALIRGIGMDAARCVVECQYLGVASADTLAMSTAREIKARVEELGATDPAARDAILPVCTALDGADAAALIAAIDDAAAFSGVKLRAPDRRREKGLVFAHERRLAGEVEAEANPAAALHLAVTLLHAQLSKAVIQWPKKLISHGVDALASSSMAEEDHKILKDLHDAIAASLRGGDDVDSGDALAKIKGVVARTKAAAVANGNEDE